jgi:hypothetical protein
MSVRNTVEGKTVVPAKPDKVFSYGFRLADPTDLKIVRRPNDDQLTQEYLPLCQPLHLVLRIEPMRSRIEDSADSSHAIQASHHCSSQDAVFHLSWRQNREGRPEGEVGACEREQNSKRHSLTIVLDHSRQYAEDDAKESGAYERHAKSENTRLTNFACGGQAGL